MRILLTNDDGIEAEGLESLARIAGALSDDVWVCAPAVEQSGKGRGITLTEPLRVMQFGEKRFAVTGTPTDCVVLAVNDLMPERPDLVLSGVNRGHNIGEDVSYSGTVAGALQGMAMGIPSITTQGFRDVTEMHAVRRTDLRGRHYYWMGFRSGEQSPKDGTDLRAIAEGRISVTPLHIDLTHLPTVRDLRGVLGGPPPKLKEPAGV